MPKRTFVLGLTVSLFIGIAIIYSTLENSNTAFTYTSPEISGNAINNPDLSSSTPEVEDPDDRETTTDPRWITVPGVKDVSVGASKAYLTVKSHGKLGNQMFQYAALYCLTASKTTWTPYLGEKKAFNRLIKTFQDNLLLGIDRFTADNVLEIVEPELPDADEMLRTFDRLPTNRNITIIGYLQSHKFFAACRHSIRKQFTFPDAWRRSAQAELRRRVRASFGRAAFVRVGIHVRRTSMIVDSRLSMGYVSPPARYYRRAMEYFLRLYERVVFLVTSDDVSWCRDNIRAEHVLYLNNSAGTDLLVHALCDHVIISVGTYSWWAGWLNTGTTVYYGPVPDDDTYAGRLYANDSYIPNDEYNNWIPIT